MKIIRAKYALGKAVVVADKGMNTHKNAYYLANSRGGYIFSQTVRGGTSELKAYVLKNSGYKEMDGGFKMKSRQFTRDVKFEDDNGEPIHTQIPEKQLVFYSPDYDRREKELRAPAIEKAMDLIKTPGKYNKHNSFGAAKYVSSLKYDKKTGEIVTPAEMLRFDDDKLAEEEKYDGYYLIVTCRYNESDDWMLEHYKGLWQIEESFRVTKSDLEARPVYVSLYEHINAHFLVCFIALVIIRLIQLRLGRAYSPEIIIENLARACCTYIERNWFIFDHRTEALDEIGKVLGIDFSYKYMTSGDIRKALGATKK
jgi:transposase